MVCISQNLSEECNNKRIDVFPGTWQRQADEKTTATRAASEHRMLECISDYITTTQSNAIFPLGTFAQIIPRPPTPAPAKVKYLFQHLHQENANFTALSYWMLLNWSFNWVHLTGGAWVMCLYLDASKAGNSSSKSM